MMAVISFILCHLLFVGAASAQFALRDVLARYPQLSSFTALVTNSSALSTRFFEQADNFTLLAPANTAIATWLSTNISQAQVEAVLFYHLLDGRYPTASITNSSVVIQTALTNETYANVTGGQRVEVSNTGVVEFQSDAKAISKIITGDIVGNNGFIHIIDSVLQIPSIFGVAASKANLTYLLALVDRGNYLQNTTFSWDIASRRDSTYFAPNSAAALAHIPSNGNQSTYDALLEYHCVSKLVYSTDLVNGTELPTFNGGKVLVTVDEDGSIYVNTAKVVETDYLVFNGVMHTLDDLLDPQKVTRTPASTSTVVTASVSTSTTTAEATNALPTGARAGIGIGVAVIVISLVIGVLLICRGRRRDKRFKKALAGENGYALQDMNDRGHHEVQPPQTTESPAEVFGSPPGSPVAELPVYPQQQLHQDQEPKSLIRGPEWHEPKILSTSQAIQRLPL